MLTERWIFERLQDAGLTDAPSLLLASREVRGLCDQIVGAIGEVGEELEYQRNIAESFAKDASDLRDEVAALTDKLEAKSKKRKPNQQAVPT